MNDTQSAVILGQNVLGMFDAVSLLASIASLILAIIAIWLAMSFKRDSDKVNRNTSAVLVEIKAESRAISQGVMSELKAYGEAMRGSFSNNSAAGSSFSGQASEYSVGNNTTESTSRT